MERSGFVYILASKGQRLYIGVTTQLSIRVQQHKEKLDPNSFTARYNIDRLVYYEVWGTIAEAINRERKLKDLHRLEKIKLIVASNPVWEDLSLRFGTQAGPMICRFDSEG